MDLVAREWYSPLCDSAFKPDPEWDLTACFQTTTVASIPIIILISAGLLEFIELQAKYRAGARPEKGGVAAYRVKLVRSRSPWSLGLSELEHRLLIIFFILTFMHDRRLMLD